MWRQLVWRQIIVTCSYCVLCPALQILVALMGILFPQFLLCEILNFAIDVINIYLTDFFLGGRFMR